MYTAAGGSSVYTCNLLKRGFRDVHMAGAELAKPRKISHHGDDQFTVPSRLTVRMADRACCRLGNASATVRTLCGLPPRASEA